MKMNKLSLLGAVSAWVLTAGVGQVQAACSFDGVDTFNCTDLNVGGVVENANPNITVNVTVDGKAEAADGVDLSNGIGGTYTINNDGIINGTAANGILVLGSGDALVLNNNAGGSVVGLDSGVFVTNVNDIQINNAATATIEGSNDNGFAIFASSTLAEAESFNLQNSGDVISGNSGVALANINNIVIANLGQATIIADADKDGADTGIAIAITKTDDVLDVMINNEQDASIESYGLGPIAAAILIEDVGTDEANERAVITNDGKILASLAAIKAISIEDLTINNNETGIILGGQDVNPGSAISLSETNAVINNSGEIHAHLNSAAIASVGVFNGVGDLTLEVNNQGLIQSVGTGGKGIIAFSLESVLINNSVDGDILANGVAISSADVLKTVINSDGYIESQDFNAISVTDSSALAGDSLEINNGSNATILAENIGIFVNGIENITDSDPDDADGNTNGIFNAGLIRAGDRGIFIQGALNGDIANTGDILTTNVGGIAITVVDNAGTEDVFNLFNSGLVESTGINSQGVTTSDVSRVVIDNSGTIRAEDIAINLISSRANLINNEALGEIISVSGTTAILSTDTAEDIFNHHGFLKGDALFNGNNDAVNLFTGMVIDADSIIDAGEEGDESDVDTLTLLDVGVGEGSTNLDQMHGFELGALNSGDWTVAGTGVTTFDQSFTLGSVDGGILRIGGVNPDYNTLTINTPVFNHVASGKLVIHHNGAVNQETDVLVIRGGAANLEDGSEVELILDQSLDLKIGDIKDYTFLTADAGVNGEFSIVSPTINSFVVSREIIYDPNEVTARYSRIAYEDVEGLKYFNHITTAVQSSAILQAGVYSGGVESLLLRLDDEGDLSTYKNILAAVDGEAYFGFNRMLIQSNDASIATISNHLRTRSLACPERTDQTVTCFEDKFTFWGDVTYGNNDLDRQEEHFEFENEITSFSAGVDVALSDRFEIGGMVSYHDVETDIASPGGLMNADADAQIVGVDVYFRDSAPFSDRSYAIVGLGYHHASDMEMDRDLYIPASENQAAIWENFEGDADGRSLSAFLEAGWEIPVGSMEAVPYVRADFQHIDIDNTTERSTSNLAQHVNLDEVNRFAGEFGVNLQGIVENGETTMLFGLTPKVKYIFSGIEQDSEVNYAHLPSEFSTPNQSNDDGQFTYGVGGKVGVRFGNVVLDAEADYVTGSGLDAWNAAVRASINF